MWVAATLGFTPRLRLIIASSGGTLTHHHAVGYEHMPWMEREVGETGLRALGAMKQELDPKGIMNPGKLIPTESEAREGRWHFSEEVRRPEASL